VIPDVLKISCVTPVYKKGDPKSMKNYRPISILSVFSKTRLVDFIHRYAIFYARPAVWESVLFDFVARTQQLIELKLKVGMKFYDLSQAFDSVNIEILLEKLAAIKILGNDLNWFKSYVSNCTQYTDMNCGLSNRVTRKNGVPQQIVLGPTYTDSIIYT
jgi:hypothetical protein